MLLALPAAVVDHHRSSALVGKLWMKGRSANCCLGGSRRVAHAARYGAGRSTMRRRSITAAPGFVCGFTARLWLPVARFTWPMIRMIMF